MNKISQIFQHFIENGQVKQFNLILTYLLTLILVILLGLYVAIMLYEGVFSDKTATVPPLQVSNQKSQVKTLKQINSEVPRNITIGSQIHNLPVRKGVYKNGQWELSDREALFLDIGGQLGEFGNVIIYGHNTIPVFGKLKIIQKGDIITITGNLGNIYKYKIKQIKLINSSDTSILSQPADEKFITLYTCSGWMDEKRLVLIGSQIN